VAAATVTELRNMLGGLAGMSDTVVSQYLDDAEIEVVNAGVAVSESGFGLLQRYWAAHLISGKGGEGSPVASESVDDVSTSWQTPGGSIQFGTSWLDKFEAARAKILGMEYRIA
jgi:hypothetical protein